ncbi:MAG: tRNA (adenosine(37)-N6)-threonylcarbamoyltransferase complex dimerization subunit type 1 TsaB [Anaerolineae bacterium]
MDTATNYLGLALYHADELIAEQIWRTDKKKHTTILAPTITRMMQMCNVTYGELSMVAVASGPGSHTGLRIGVAMAKGMATANQLPLIGVNTLDIIALGQSFVNAKHRLICILPAGRGRIVARVYQVKKGRWTAGDDPELTNWADLLASLEAGAYYFAGEIDRDGLDAIDTIDSPDHTLTVIDPAQRTRRPAILAREAWQRYHDGAAEDFLPARLAPDYLSTPG